MEGLVIKDISKTWADGRVVLDHIDLEIGEDEFLVLLGPSGCGKSTLLRVISGLSDPDEGEIFLCGERITEKEPAGRRIGMVFQNYALFPHRTIGRNLSFPLETAHTGRAERKKIIHEVANMLAIGDIIKRQPAQVSGGERQRAAIGRAMVRPADLYLFDEPLSNLDESRRIALRQEIVRLHKELKKPFLFVTHDHIDALSMGTKLAVMEEGRLVQIGTPQEVYSAPVNQFVAGFVGTPRMNLMEVPLVVREGKPCCSLFGAEWEVPPGQTAKITVGIRPEELFPEPSGIPEADRLGLKGRLIRYEICGGRILLYLKNEDQVYEDRAYEDQVLRALVPADIRARVNETVTVWADRRRCHYFDERGVRFCRVPD